MSDVIDLPSHFSSQPSSGNRINMEKEDTVEHTEHHGSSDSEKAVDQPSYPVNEEDYEVTFKTWIVVTILASAYGVSRPLFSGTIRD
jgi:hypothetical protein